MSTTTPPLAVFPSGGDVILGQSPNSRWSDVHPKFKAVFHRESTKHGKPERKEQY
jgi:hypothetical protein